LKIDTETVNVVKFRLNQIYRENLKIDTETVNVVNMEDFEEIKADFELYNPKDQTRKAVKKIVRIYHNLNNLKNIISFYPCKCYSMKNNLTGPCLIINNQDFDIQEGTLSTRTGAKVDDDRFEKLFKKLNFEILKNKILSNRTKNQIMKEDLKEFIDEIKKNEEKYDALVLIIMTHGKSGDQLYGSDYKIFKVTL
jgi:hypothetical protein